MPFSYYCSCKCKFDNCCPNGTKRFYRTPRNTEITPRLDDDILRFSLGKCFAKMKIKVTATFSHSTQTDDITQQFCLKTNQTGNYQIPLPVNFPIDTTVTIFIKLDLDQPCPKKICPKTLVKIDGYYPPYSYYDLNWASWDGSGNNLYNPYFGKSNEALLRQGSADYADGSSTLAVRGPNNPNPRVVSNNIHKNISGNVPNSLGLTDSVWQFLQLLDHEIDLTEPTSGETAHIITPTVIVDPEEDYPSRIIEFTRSGFIAGSDPREQPNQISSYIDATNVYGYTTDRAYALRTLDGTGKLKTTLADNGEVLLPYNTLGLHNAMPNGSNPEDFFLAGDIRSNENIFLTSLHTLFAREHNRLCDHIISQNPIWNGKDELIYQHARRFVSGQMSKIAFEDAIPALLGEKLPAYTGYNPNIEAGISNEFSTAAYRLGHSMLTSNLRSGPNVSDTILLRNAFFNPSYIQTNGIDNLLIGGTLQKMQEIDNEIVDDVRNFLFSTPSVSHLLDLATLNIQRGRDHGLPDYNDFRVAFGLTPKTDFNEVTSDTSLAAKLATLYISPDHGDPFTCILCEDKLPGAAVGETIHTVLKNQFIKLRDGDRFYYENDPALSDEEKTEIRQTKLSDIIIRNTQWTSADIRSDIFHL